MKRPGALGVTGTPGTGKKSISPILAGLLRMELVEINSFARTRAAPREGDELVVDTKKLGSQLAKRGTTSTVVSGHLLADVLKPASAEFVVVLRCDPAVLKRRLASRGYLPDKVLENVEAELIGVVLDGAVRRFGAAKVHEYDSTGTSPVSLAKRIADDYLAGRAQASPWVDWTLDYDSSARLRSLLSRPRTEPAST